VGVAGAVCTSAAKQSPAPSKNTADKVTTLRIGAYATQWPPFRNSQFPVGQFSFLLSFASREFIAILDTCSRA
jgi:hypothetical protein